LQQVADIYASMLPTQGDEALRAGTMA